MKGDYQPIPGLGSGRASFRIATRASLYAGPDHLLVVHSNGYTEDYRRIFYRDIRYVVAQKSHAQLIQIILSGVMLAGLALFYLTPMSKVLLTIFLLPFLIWLIVNLVRGATCRCSINTDVQTIELPTPRRFSKLPVLAAFLKAQGSQAEVIETEPAGT
jgi:hypothetical protein